MTKNVRDYALIYINGLRYEVRGKQAFMMLADFLRYERGLTGTKIVCAEGDCGACTVLRARPRKGQKGPVEFESINSCVIAVAQLDGNHLVTVEGLQLSGQLSGVQEAIATCHGAQCGYCTPGFTMAITGLLQRPRPDLDAQAVKNYLTGNLCRCTGYTPLIEAALSLKDAPPLSLEARYLSKDRLKDTWLAMEKPMHIKIEGQEFMAPLDLKAALRWRRTHREARLFSAATDLGVQINKGKFVPKQWLSLQLIPELYELKSSAGRIRLGARVSLAELRRFCQQKLPELAAFIDLFASPQIKSMATLVGNIANASPIGDSLPFMLVADGQVHVACGSQSRDIPMTALYTGYKQLALKPSEIISHVSFKLPSKQERLRLYKVSQRKDLDIASINCAFQFSLLPQSEGQEPRIKTARMAYGGAAATVTRCDEAERFLIGKNLSEATIAQALEIIQQQLSPQSDLRGTFAYRRVLIENMFRKYCQELKTEGVPHAAP